MADISGDSSNSAPGLPNFESLILILIWYWWHLGAAKCNLTVL